MSGDIYECDKCGGSISTSRDCAWDSDLLLFIANEEIKILEGAVRFYANKMSYSLDDYRGISGEMMYRNILYGDMEEINEVSSVAGKQARQALEKLKEIRKKK